MHLLGNVDFWEKWNIIFSVSPTYSSSTESLTLSLLRMQWIWTRTTHAILLLKCTRKICGAIPRQNASYMHNSYCALQIFALLKVNEVKGKTKAHWCCSYLALPETFWSILTLQEQLWNEHIPTTHSQEFWMLAFFQYLVNVIYMQKPHRGSLIIVSQYSNEFYKRFK